MKKFLEEFKAFINKGNVLGLAVGVIIGGAFSSITTSLTNDIIMPIVAIFLGGVDFSSMAIRLPSPFNVDPEAAPNMLNYGNFISAVINFFIMALVVFFIVKAVNKVMDTARRPKHEEPAAPEEPPAPTAEELLTEIRDLMKANVKAGGKK